MDRDELIQKINALLEDIILATSSKKLLEEISKYDKEEKYHNVIQKYPCFWNLTIRNIESNIALITAKLYDAHKDCFGLQKLINVCEQSPKLFPERRELFGEVIETDVVSISKKAQTLLNNMKSQSDLLREHRDKNIAHKDKQYIIRQNKLYEGYPLTWGDIDDLLHTATGICNIFLAELTEKAIVPIYSNFDDIFGLLDNAHIGSLYRHEFYTKKNKSMEVGTNARQ